MVPSVRFEIPSCPGESVAQLCRELAIGPVLAQVLVRRGLGEVDAARRFLAADVSHPPGAFAGMKDAVQLIQAHLAGGRRIAVHGDYDVDGICSTAILVGALRRLVGGQAGADRKPRLAVGGQTAADSEPRLAAGGQAATGGKPSLAVGEQALALGYGAEGSTVSWHIPSRHEGYGLREDTVRSLAADGTALLITTDCGIACASEVALARGLGMDVVVTDHHAPPADGHLPDAPIVHPSLCRYPFEGLCAAAVAHKLAQALFASFGHDPAKLDSDLDLVALATIADVVPLLGENRSLARRGLAALGRTPRPGLRALMAVAAIDPSRVDERAVGFGLAPRLNAAGRLYNAASALELVMTASERRAAELARELDRCNHERRELQQRILFEAEAQVRELGPMAGYVLAGEGWHPGVVGIVASRIAEHHNRPVVMVALDGASGRGSARSIPSFDLLGGLTACGRHLVRYGGHRAAAGVELERSCLEDFRASFAAHAAEAIAESDLAPVEHVDAIVSCDQLGIDTAEELAHLAPFGHGNPPPRLLLRDAEISQIRPMGEGRHARFTVSHGPHRALGVAFGVEGRLPVEEGTSVDATFTLEVNEWRGACEPRLIFRHALVKAHQRAPVKPCPHVLAKAGREEVQEVVEEIDQRPPLQLELPVA